MMMRDNLNNFNKFRLVTLFLTLLSFGLFGASLYFQYAEHLEPCPLCMAQRMAILLLALTYLWALFIEQKFFYYINTFLQLFFALFGASMAGRQVWLIYTPEIQRPGCMPDMSVLWQYLPFNDFIHAFLNGTVSCAESPWRMFGLAMPEWTLGFFVFFIIASIILLSLRKK